MTSPPAPPTDEGRATLETFRGLRYARVRGPELAALTLEPPPMWDFAALAGRADEHDRHVLRLLSPSLTGEGPPDVTATAWQADATLTSDESAGLYAWAWTGHGRGVVGVAGALSLPAPGVAPHEQVRRGLLRARANELGNGRVQAEPILLLYDGVTPLVAGGPAADPVVELDLVDEEHRVVPLTDGAVARVNDALAGQRLVVADGHHRFAVLGSLPPPRPHAFVLVVDVRRSQLAVGPIPRVVSGLRWEPVVSTPGAVVTDVEDTGRADYLAAAGPDELRWVVADVTRTLGLQLSHRAAAALRPDAATPTARLARDICYLHTHLLPAWGAGADRLHYAHSWPTARAEATATSGLALEARAPSLEEVMAAARSGTELPHKATSITPKPRVGLLMFDDATVPG